MNGEAPSVQRRFRDRADAGRILADRMAHYAGRDDVLVFGLPRGGVPVAAEVARALGARLDVFLVRKLGLPGQEELAMGAIASGGALVLNEELVETIGIRPEVIEEVATREGEELKRREALYRGSRPPPDAEGKTVIIVDDGLATGSSMRAAVGALRRLGSARIVVAVPVAPASTCEQLRPEVDELVCARTPQPFYAVGIWYENFNQVTDDEVRALVSVTMNEHTISFESRGVRLEGTLVEPDDAQGIVLFAHGTGSSRFSPRNQFVAHELNGAGLATLLIDLLTAEEERSERETGHLRFDIGLLAERLLAATDAEQSGLPLGYFGASTGAAAALVAAAERPERVGAVVSRGGRPDLAGEALPRVRAPTLLIVGGDDRQVLELNRQAMARLRCETELKIVPGATHLFEEPGTLERVAELASAWLKRHLAVL